MEKLHISPTKTREAVRALGNEVLLLTYPTVTGDTPTACHAAALIDALVHYAKTEIATGAAQALQGAIASGRLFDFTRHTYDLALTTAPVKRGVLWTLTARHNTGNGVVRERALTMLWDAEECLQVRAYKCKI